MRTSRSASFISASALAVALLSPAAATAADRGVASEGGSPSTADAEQDVQAAANFSCLLPRTGTFTNCARTFKGANQRIDVSNRASGGRTVRVRARTDAGVGTNGVAIAPGERRTVHNAGPGTAANYNIQARVSVPGVRVQFEGTTFVVTQ